MTLTAAEITIANLALMRIGNTKLIATSTDATNEQRVATAMYGYARDFVLADHPWPFATKRASLATASGTAPTNWAYLWTYPADAAKVRKVLSTAATRKDEPVPFQVITLGTSTAICTNDTPVSVEYTAKVSDPTLFDPTFVSALAYYLAAEMALPLRADVAMAKGALDAYGAIKQQTVPEGLPEATVTRFDSTATVTDVAITNMAFAKLGHLNFITAFADHTNEARLGSLFYAKARDFVLADFPWEFATKTATLAGGATSSDARWDFVYTYPTDCLKARKVTVTGRDEPQPFEVVNAGTATKVYTNATGSAALTYTVQVTDPTRFSPAFTEALTYYLASEMSLPLKVPPEVAKAVVDAYHGIRKNLELPVNREGMPKTEMSYVDGTTSTQVAICNKALGRLGYKHKIAALTDDTDAARACAMYYGGAVAYALRDFPWSFASKRVTLSTITSGTFTASTVTNWGYAYGVPTDCAFAREIVGYRRPSAEQQVPFEIGLDTTGTMVLYTDMEEAELLYTSTVATETNYDPIFKDALAWRLAADIAPDLGLAQFVPAMMQMYARVISTAKARDHAEGVADPEPDCSFITSRS